ncbi:MAG: hypothetical protein ABSD31_06750 [Candidatus Binataceae bacterium]|jgi:hypothetical protein
MFLKQTVDQIVCFAQGNELERRLSVNRDHYRLVMAKLPVSAQLGLGLTQWNDFHER